MNENLKCVNIYTDGACSGNPGPGGWGAILEFGPHRKELSGYMAGTTNNRMELFAAISALGALKEPCNVKLYSDSNYLVQAFNDHWIDNWMKNGWKTSGGSKVENQDLWFILNAQTRKHHVEFIKVKGSRGANKRITARFSEGKAALFHMTGAAVKNRLRY